jgi:hypothetical protein
VSVNISEANRKSEVKLTDLTPDNVTLADLKRFPPMTGWFGPILLSKLLLRVIISDVFGQYADRRLVHAALDTDCPTRRLERADLSNDMVPDHEGAVWIDFLADLGDGFDATYAMAYLIAQPELAIGELRLPRASALVMGGDEVYPTATRDNYTIKVRKPYSFARPDTKPVKRSPLLTIPGNHDWYDGLVTYLAIFCRDKSTAVGDWGTRQRRSYFAAKLTDKWWVWGIDIALVRDMDQPQADYFVSIASAMPNGSNIILCSAEPGWYKAESGGDSFRSLSYAAWIAENANRDLRIPLVLSGDSHHYARYSGSGAQYITSGGGGAFLHGTLELKPTIKAEWLKEREPELKLQNCYPSKDVSRDLLKGNIRFFSLNREFSFTLGALYWLYAYILTIRWHLDAAIILYLSLAAGFYFYSRYQEGKVPGLIRLASIHALAHFSVILGFAWLALALHEYLLSWLEWHWFFWAVLVAVLVFPLGSVIAGTIFGLNLLVTCKSCDINHNDAFSAMKLNSHRNFLRMRIKDGTLTVYPVKLDRVPERSEWVLNPRRTSDKSASLFTAPLRPELVEPPIIIKAQHGTPTSEIKKPSEPNKP